MSDAVVMTGAAMKGAFTAGALSVLTDPRVMAQLRLDVRHVVGASSGAMNGAYYAASIRQGAEIGAGSRLARVWTHDITALRLFHPSLRGILGGRGVFDMKAMLRLMRKRLVATGKPGSGEVTLKLALTNVEGRTFIVDGRPTTSFEEIATFYGETMDSPEGLERVRTTAAASASIPLAFVPVEVQLGSRTIQAVDGGTVDDTPLAHALTDTEVRRVFIIDPYPRSSPPITLRWTNYAGQILHILVQQRLVHDLQSARRVNDALGRLQRLLPNGQQRARVLSAVGWAGRREVEIVEIRPSEPLPGGDLTAAFSRSMRAQYVQIGIDTARRELRRR